MPFRFGGWELILILAIVLIIFGVGRLPEIGGAMGKAIREFRRSSSAADEPKPTAKTKRVKAKAETQSKEASKAK